MKNSKFVCLCVTLLFVFHSAFGFDYKFNRIDAEDGLSNNEVKCIFKDSKGFMWFGTPSGLNRYDGYDVLRVNQNLSAIVGASNNDIERIQESADRKLWLKTAFGYSIYDLKLEKFEYDISPFLEKYFGEGVFHFLYIDNFKNLWFPGDEEVRIYDIKKEERKTLLLGGANNLSQGVILDMAHHENRYWFLYDNGLIECLDAQTHQVIKRDSTLYEKMEGAISAKRRLFVDSKGDLWVYNTESSFGLALLHVGEDRWETFSTEDGPSNYISNNIVFSLVEDDKGIIWAGTDHGGISLIDRQKHETKVILMKEDDPLSLPENSIKCLYCDDLGIVWLGTYKQGIGYYHVNNFRFGTTEERAPMPYGDVNVFKEDEVGNLWIGTNGGGLLYYNVDNDTYKQYKPMPGNPMAPSGNVIVPMEYDKEGNLWVGYYLKGMDKYDGRHFTNYRQTSKDPTSPNYFTCNNVWALRCDRNGMMWIGTLSGGVMLMDPKTGDILKYYSLDGSVYDIIEKKSGEILIGTQYGLLVYDKANDELVPYEPDIISKAQVGRYDINSLYEDSRGLIWIGTRNGLFVFNPFSKDLQLFTPDNGLSANLIQVIVEDSQQNIWVSSNRGLSSLNVYTRSDEPGYFFRVNNYDENDGLQGQQFNKGAGMMFSNSKLVFGGMYGFNIFQPSDVISTTGNPRVVLTDFQLNNISIRPGESYFGRDILNESITETKDIKLRYSDNFFSLSFAAQNYYNAGKARYYYMLEGFNDKWLEADRDNRKVTYTNLNPGKYVFHLKAISNDMSLTEYPVSLNITVAPPFWRSPFAFVVYGLIIIGLLFGYWLYTTKRAEKRLMYAHERLQNIQQHQIHEMKLRFFTNISHEFRTPLTLIITPLEGLLKKTKDPEEKVTLSIMHRNALQLLQLVNQLLDFRKLDAKSHTMNKALGDMGDFIRDQCVLFSEAMSRKSIKLSILTNPRHLYLWFDADKMAKVLVNLLFNAHKFTPQGGSIEVAMSKEEDNKVRITVTDNGIGIPEHALEKIFERFYQVKQEDAINQQDGGNGVGLHLAKEFVTLHGGEMWAENVPGGGSRFIIILPNVEENPSEQEMNEIGASLKQSQEKAMEEKEMNMALVNTILSKNDEKPKLLLVEDNDDFRMYLSAKLKEHYVILEAPDGEAGQELAFQEIPDMILADVMMPQLDGIEMSKRIKSDIRTSHIPIILLTAKSGEESKLEGLTAGADDYITKPFNMDILMVKIHNLVERGKLNRQTFKEQIKIEPSKITVNSLDEQLISSAISYTEANISNPDFSVEELSRELGMSRVNLYKKLTSLTGKSPIEFIRVIRLKRAAQLLTESQLTVSEIAYAVGFNNPKYFRKYFKEEFGELPSQYGKRDE